MTSLFVGTERMKDKVFKLNPKQEEAYSKLKQGNSIFITGAGGVGKTALIKTFMKVYENNIKIAVTSTTGTSALLLNGSTIHSYLGIGYGKETVETMVNKIIKWKWLRERWVELQCLFIDEISMLNPDLFDKIEEVARLVRRDKRPFGGIQIVVSGDYLQLPCIGTDKFCFQAKSWEKCIDNTIYLTEIIRQNDKVFQEVLNKIRLGNIDNQVKEILNSRLGADLTNKYGIKPTKLYATNKNVDLINERELDKLAIKGREFYEYEMDITFYPNIKNHHATREKFTKNCMAPEILQICIGTQVMLLKNLDLAIGLANGSRGVVIGFVDENPLVRFLNGVESIVEREIWEYEDGSKKILQASQVPLKVAYAITIHKCQGSTLDYTEINLSGVFEYGQAYVALSRVKNLEGLSIIGNFDYDCIQAHPEALKYYETLK